MISQPLPNDDEHLPQDLLDRLFEDDPLDMSKVIEVSRGETPLIITAESAVKVGQMGKEAAELDTLMAIWSLTPAAHCFATPDATIYLADLHGITIANMTAFSAAYRSTPSQALKVLLIERCLMERKAAMPDRSLMLSVLKALESYNTDKSLWQGLIEFSVSAGDVRRSLERYKLDYERAARLVIAHRALRFDEVVIPVHETLGRIARPHDFTLGSKS